MPQQIEKTAIGKAAIVTAAGDPDRRSRTARPFWLPASGFYMLAIAASGGTFFLVWGILHDGRDETPWIGAGLAASIVLGSAVFLREIILRNARERQVIEQRMLDRTLRGVRAAHPGVGTAHKITLEQNAQMLRHIEKKSEAARMFGKLPEGHREVFDLCDEYLAAISRELPNVAIGSPRIAAFKNGERVVREVHRFHMMQWAEIESRALSLESSKRVKVAEKIESAGRAVDIVDAALSHYPDEPALIESRTVLAEVISSLEVSSLVEKAERAEKRSNLKRALVHYRHALGLVQTGFAGTEDDRAPYERITREIARLESMLEGPTSETEVRDV